jgi:uncharacterized membrane protein
MVMTRRGMLRSIDEERLRDAIREAEARTSGEICVSIAPLFWGDIEKAADKAFIRLGMTRTRHRNGVLFFVIPARHKFVVLGDRGIHEKVGEEFWRKVADAVSEQFREGDFTGGLVKGIEEVAGQLAAHFPYEHTDVNELKDDIDFAGE